MIQQLYKALYLAIPISSALRDICNYYGISHLIALSGFHLAVLSFLIYWIFYFPYSFFHKRYFPFRNKKYDLLLVTIGFLFFYLLLTNIVPSLLRAFVLMVLGIYMLRCNIKVFSFISLWCVFLIVVALFPKYIFSLSFWFSISGVFYIYLFIEYFKDIKNKVVQVLFFNFWIYLAMNPIVHYFFPLTTYEQLLSPFITIAFTLFYPISLFLHFIGFGSFFDEYLLMFLNKQFYVFDVQTQAWFFAVFIAISFISIFNKKAFYFLNVLLVLFTLYLYIP